MARSVAINPPKMCQPMGAILAYMGVHGCVPLVHGSQGCSTSECVKTIFYNVQFSK